MGGATLLLLFQSSGSAPTTYADFWEALVARLTANVPSLVGGVWAYRAPDRDANDQPLSMPFAVYDDQAGVTRDYDSVSDPTDQGSFTLAVYTASLPAARTAMKAIRSAIFDAPLLFTDGSLLYLRPSNPYFAGLDPDPGPGGIDVYQAIQTFRYLTQSAL